MDIRLETFRADQARALDNFKAGQREALERFKARLESAHNANSLARAITGGGNAL